MIVESPSAISEVAVFGRLIEPRNGSLTVAAARAWLKVDFTRHDRVRMHELAVKGQDGQLTARDEIELDTYRRVGRLLDMMHSKARHSLKKRGVSV